MNCIWQTEIIITVGKDSFLKLLSETPDAVSSDLKMGGVNQEIPVYAGEFELDHNGEIFKIEGEIVFKWFPNPGAKISGIVKTHPDEIFRSLKDVHQPFKVIVNGLVFGDCILTSLSRANQVTIKGSLAGEGVLGDKSIPVSKIVFCLPNMRGLHGLPIKRGRTVSRARLRLDADKYEIVIDQHESFREREKALKNMGGYITLYFGELSMKGGSISFSEHSKIFDCLSFFLSFLNGRKCSPIFRQGLHNNEVVWQDYTSYLTDQYKAVMSWPQEGSIEGLNEAWQRFYSIWHDNEGKGFLKSVVHWYTQANCNTGFVEGSIIMAQAALELIYNWLLIEKRNLLKGSDAEKITASNKIRLLLSQIQLGFNIPTSFLGLISIKENIDGPEVFVQIRNAIVHSQETKRKELEKLPAGAKFQALQLGIWYIELSMLYILNFNGKYFNRCSGESWIGRGVESVPWVSRGKLTKI